MEIPKKIYLHPNIGKREYIKSWLPNPANKDSIEYTRAEAFIDKVLKWYCLDCECNGNCNAFHKCFFHEAFRRYLEGDDGSLPPKIENSINPDGSTSENYRYRHFISRMRDDFIEKSCEWLSDKCLDYINVRSEGDTTYLHFDSDGLTGDFKTEFNYGE